MARMPRLSVPGHMHHVLQRGNNRQAIVVSDDDRRQLVSTIQRLCQELKIALHAYVVLPDHFHVLATPPTGLAMGLLMQSIGRSYVRYFNREHLRFGSLWEGRYRSTILQADHYGLPCMVHMDQHAVRAGLVDDALAYSWSSAQHYAGLRHDPQLTPPDAFWALGNTPFAREAAYAHGLRQVLAPQVGAQLSDAVLHGWPLGDVEFLHQLSMAVGRRVEREKPGRPIKKYE
jgi:putative transposase